MNDSENTRKIFCIGFHRTGTTTFQTALEELGFDVIGMTKPAWDAYELDDRETLHGIIRSHDAFRDMPWPLMYRWLYEAYPEATFVLTHRSSDSWLASCSGNYKNRPYRMFEVIYGFDVFMGNELRAADVYKRHLHDVREFFADKPGKLLDVDLTQVNDWKLLCDFLGKEPPKRAFPHANRRPRSMVARAYLKFLKKVFPGRYKQIARDKK